MLNFHFQNFRWIQGSHKMLCVIGVKKHVFPIAKMVFNLETASLTLHHNN